MEVSPRLGAAADAELLCRFPGPCDLTDARSGGVTLQARASPLCPGFPPVTVASLAGAPGAWVALSCRGWLPSSSAAQSWIPHGSQGHLGLADVWVHAAHSLGQGLGWDRPLAKPSCGLCGVAHPSTLITLAIGEC